jgi:hypothetical protein
MRLPQMLTQQQVDRACKLLKLRSPRSLSVMQLDRDIARLVGCNASTIARLRRGVRDRRGKIEFRFPKMAQTECPRCGVVPGTYCVVCAAREGVQKMSMTPLKPKDGVDVVVKRKPYSRRPDPTPEEIAERAVRLRELREAAMRDVRNSRVSSEL